MTRKCIGLLVLVFGISLQVTAQVRANSDSISMADALSGSSPIIISIFFTGTHGLKTRIPRCLLFSTARIKI